MLKERVPTKPTTAPVRTALDHDALRTLALEDAIRAHATPFQRSALVAWVTMLLLAAGFLAAVAVSAVLDASGVAF
jgi:hypothetical protein